MPSRRSHTKSRHGCLRCKQKRIKCDEARPNCGGCSKHGLVCEFGDLGVTKMSISHIMSGSGPSQVVTPPGSGETPSPAQNDAEPIGSSTLPPSQQLDPKYTLNMRDLELLHNYFTNIVPTIADSDDLIEVWKGPAVEVAFHYPFLMHGMLSVSSLHQALTSPSKDTNYHELAIRQERALELYRPNLDHITEDNCHAILLFSTLIALTAFAFPRLPGPVKTTDTILDELIDVVAFIKSIGTIVHRSYDWIAKGPVSHLLRRDLMTMPVQGPSDEQKAHCHELEQLNERSQDPPSVKAINKDGINALDAAYHIQWDKTAMPFIWPHAIGDDFHTLLRQRNPVSLTILAFYTVMLSCRDEMWWSGGCGKLSLTAISQIIDREYLPAISWPMAKLGVSPPEPADVLKQEERAPT